MPPARKIRTTTPRSGPRSVAMTSSRVTVPNWSQRFVTSRTTSATQTKNEFSLVKTSRANAMYVTDEYILLSNILEKMGRRDEARAALAQVSRLRALAGNQAIVN